MEATSAVTFRRSTPKNTSSRQGSVALAWYNLPCALVLTAETKKQNGACLLHTWAVQKEAPYVSMYYYKQLRNL